MIPIFSNDDDDSDLDDDDDSDLDDDDSDLDDDHDSDLDDDHDSDLDDGHEENSPPIIKPTLRSVLFQRLGSNLHPCRLCDHCGDYVGRPFSDELCLNCGHLQKHHQ